MPFFKFTILRQQHIQNTSNTSATDIPNKEDQTKNRETIVELRCFFKAKMVSLSAWNHEVRILQNPSVSHLWIFLNPLQSQVFGRNWFWLPHLVWPSNSGTVSVKEKDASNTSRWESLQGSLWLECLRSSWHATAPFQSHNWATTNPVGLCCQNQNRLMFSMFPSWKAIALRFQNPNWSAFPPVRFPTEPEPKLSDLWFFHQTAPFCQTCGLAADESPCATFEPSSNVTCVIFFDQVTRTK